MRDREEIKKILAERLRSSFQDGQVDVTDGFNKNIHVTVISGYFKGMPEERKQDALWKAVDSTELTQDDKQLISLILPFAPDEVPSSQG